MYRWVLGILLTLGGAGGADTADSLWPQFLGPGGRGAAAENTAVPVQFGPGKSMLWKAELPLGHGSPCVWGDRIFVTAFDDKENKLEVVAVSRTNGAIAWRRPIPAKELEAVHQVSSPATSTPATDGERLYVYFGSFGLVAFDRDGNVVWEHPMELSKMPFGSGNSPLVAGDVVVVSRDYPPAPFLLAVNRKTGKLAWRVDLPKTSMPGPNAAHSTPVLWKGQIVLHRPTQVAAYNPKDGTRLWHVATTGGGTSTPTADDDAIYVTAFNVMGNPEGGAELPPFATALEKYDKDKDGKLSRDETPPDDLFLRRRAGVGDNVPGAHFTLKLFFNGLDENKDGFIDEEDYARVNALLKTMVARAPTGGLLAIRPSGEGELDASSIKWTITRNVPEVPAPLSWQRRVYMIGNGGILTCADAATGTVHYRARVNAPGAYYASPVAGAGKVFVASSDGVVTVLNAGEQLEILANNDLGEPVFGTPAFAGGAIYIRSARHLWAFGNR
jgi:outer membrane protein assembly factor BamB